MRSTGISWCSDEPGRIDGSPHVPGSRGICAGGMPPTGPTNSLHQRANHAWGVGCCTGISRACPCTSYRGPVSTSRAPRYKAAYHTLFLDRSRPNPCVARLRVHRRWRRLRPPVRDNSNPGWLALPLTSSVDLTHRVFSFPLKSSRAIHRSARTGCWRRRWYWRMSRRRHRRRRSR